jgi:hypothetical protein
MSTDLWFRTKEAMKIIKEMKIYSDLWDFVRRVATEDMICADIVEEAKTFLWRKTNGE